MPELGRPIRVLHLQRHLIMGGLQTVVLGLLRHFDPAVVQSVVCSVMEGGFSEADHRATGAPVIVMGMPLWRLPAAPWAVARLVREHQIDIIHTHLPWLEPIAIAAASIAGGTGLVFHEHMRVGSTVIPPWLQAPFARRADRIVAVSDSVARDVVSRLRAVQNRVVTVHNAADIDRIDQASPSDLRGELGLPADTLLLGFAGRLIPLKGVRVAIEACAELRQTDPRVHLVVVGDGTLRLSLEKQARALGIADAVHFVGTRRDVPGILKSVDVYVQPSLWEGLPMVVLEAMAAGVAVVATGVDGTPELVVDGETGLLVPPRDPGAFAAAISSLLSAPERRQAMGRAGRQRVEDHFTFAAAARKVESIYREVMEAR